MSEALQLIDLGDGQRIELVIARPKLQAAATRQQLLLQAQLSGSGLPVMKSKRMNQYLDCNAALRLSAHLLRHF